LARELRERGYLPGLWFAPFVCVPKSETYRLHPEWLERDAKSAPVRSGYNPLWGGNFYALDVEHEEARGYIAGALQSAVAQGFSLLKLDFLYAAAHQHRRNKPRGRRMRETLEWVRRSVPDATLLACGVPLGPAFGLVEYCRIGGDVSLRWEDRFLGRVGLRERPSTASSLSSTIGRRHLDGHAFVNDADVFILRESETALSKSERRTLLLINHIFGGLLFTSDDVGQYDTWGREAFLGLFPLKSPRVREVSHDHPRLRAELEVEGQRYLLFSNLGRSPLDFALQDGRYYDNARGLFTGGPLLLAPHESVLARVIERGLLAVAGSPHFFPGAELTLSATSGGYSLQRDPEARAQEGDVCLLVEEELERVRINGIERAVVSEGEARVVRISIGAWG
jgi:alpha-galactosidase